MENERFRRRLPLMPLRSDIENFALIKVIGEASRRELVDILEKKVHLFLFVKVREGWGDDPERYRQMGLEFPKE